MTFNRIERKIHGILKRNPALKNIIKQVYQRAWASVSKKNSNFPDDSILLTGAFFGFHDKSPWSNDGSVIIAHKHSGVGNEKPEAINSVDIVSYEIGSNIERKISSTTAFNWQQGSQLQWVGASDNVIIFNDFFEGRLVARSIDIKSGENRVLEGGVAALSSDGSKRATFCFLTFGSSMPGYGYNFKANSAVSTIPADVLRIYDTKNSVELDISISEIIENFPHVLQDLDASSASNCFFSHALFSADNSKLAFMLRCQQKGRELKSKLLCYDFVNMRINIFPFTDMVSHYCWLDEERVFAFARYQGLDRFFTSGSDSATLTLVNELELMPDGHPHISDQGVIVVDTYPNRKRQQSLYLVKHVNDRFEVTDLASIYAPMKFMGTERVDLHPRINRDASWVAIDCSHTGRRSMLLVPTNL